MPKGSGLNWHTALVPGVLALVLSALGVWRCFSCRKSGWLMIADAEGIYINMSYSEGYAVKHDRISLLFVPREEIAALHRVREALRLPHRFGATRYHFGYLDITLSNPVPETILTERAAMNDRYAASGKSGPFPIRFVTPRLLRLCWNAIQPGEKEAVRLLSPPHTMESTRTVSYPEWDRLDVAQRDAFLRELWLMGMRTEAAFLGRLYFGVSLRKTMETLRDKFGCE